MADEINIHVKILTAPTRFTIEEMVKASIDIFGRIGITVKLVSTEELNINEDELAVLNTISTGACAMSGSPADEVEALSNFRNNANSKDIVLYICRTVKSSDGPLKGCGGAWPRDRPMAVIAKSAYLHTMAHEIGHVLGLDHSQNPTRLMTEDGTDVFDRPPPEPTFSEQEISDVHNSSIVI